MITHIPSFGTPSDTPIKIGESPPSKTLQSKIIIWLSDDAHGFSPTYAVQILRKGKGFRTFFKENPEVFVKINPRRPPCNLFINT